MPDPHPNPLPKGEEVKSPSLWEGLGEDAEFGGPVMLTGSKIPFPLGEG